jgi:SAM-dependent methyltransferase
MERSGNFARPEPTMQTAERVSHLDPSDNYVFQRSLLAYIKAAELVRGDVLEIGTGEGYGVEHIAPRCTTLTTIDKFPVGRDLSAWPNVVFKQVNVPRLKEFADASFHAVITFQVIEHIKNDDLFVSEMYRVLRPGGLAVVTTPNKPMSLTRNPWHVREYTAKELSALLGRHFAHVDGKGVFGNGAVMEYYDRNKAAVERLTRFDVLDLQHRLPRWALQVPYDLLNRWNRRKLLQGARQLATGIALTDYEVRPVANDCIDLFFIARKN